ncbi:MAG TPA: phospholipase D-like domain-containing protein [Polyangiales bacterium]|nr:phospholipase D-like domain-containing protein [Polyangiales bacterium]
MSVLVDAAAYYTALREAALHAQRSILIVGWDVDSRTQLVPDAEPSDGLPATLLPFLNALLQRNPALHVHVLGWDFAMLYAFERELLPSFKFALGSHARLHHALDSRHPAGASHHQKLVVIDDRVAFCGGIDLTIRRWDVPAHRADEPCRADPKGVQYAPTHDVQVAVDGAAARALGDVARERWLFATGERLQPPGPIHSRRARPARLLAWLRRAPPVPAPDPWPASAQVAFRNVEVGIARTAPAYADGRPELREIEKLTLAIIASARELLYVENQYFTSSVAVKALSARLQSPDSPEVVIVLPRMECGWMEQSSMGVLRGRALAALRRANRHGRLHVYHPTVPGLGAQCMNVHSKVIAADDRILKIGSANLSNRSMGVDTECDVAIEASERDLEVRRAIAQVIHRLVSEHLGVSVPELEQLRAAHAGSLVAAIEARRGAERCLEPLPPDPEESTINLAVLDGLVVDPEKPIDAETFWLRLMPDETTPDHTATGNAAE